jgi:NADPH:quinone reductase-like Zn-dependent oxidoreductase
MTRQLIELLAAGEIHPRIGERLSLSDVREAHCRFEAGGVLGKIVMTP